MKQYLKGSSQDDTISAVDLGDEFYNNYDGLKNYLDSLPVGTKITGIVNAPGSHWAGNEQICQKEGGYKSVYYNPWGLSPDQTKYKDSWWVLGGSQTNSHELARIITKGTRYYCTQDVFEDDDNNLPIMESTDFSDDDYEEDYDDDYGYDIHSEEWYIARDRGEDTDPFM